MLNIDIDKLLEATAAIVEDNLEMNIVDIDQLLEITTDW